MSTKAEVENSKISKNSYRGRRLEIRFLDEAQLRMVAQAARLHGQTMCGFAVGAVMAAARKAIQIQD